MDPFMAETGITNAGVGEGITSIRHDYPPKRLTKGQWKWPPQVIPLFPLIIGILPRAQDDAQGDGAQAQMIGQAFFQVT